jgi:hypothetical protein
MAHCSDRNADPLRTVPFDLFSSDDLRSSGPVRRWFDQAADVAIPPVRRQLGECLQFLRIA